MSNQSMFGRRGRDPFPSIPRGEVLATYATYVEAQQAVDKLAKEDFPVKKLSIIGNDLKSVERVTGKLTYGRVALAGAASGAWLGLFFGLLMLIFSPVPNYGLVAAALLIGAAFGMLFGIFSYLINRRKRDFTSIMQVIAGSYQVIVDPSLANKARNALDQAGTSHPSRSDAAEPESESEEEEPSLPQPSYDPSPAKSPETQEEPGSQPLPPPEYGERR